MGQGPPALAELRDMDNPNRIPDHYMVFFKDGVPGKVVRSAIDALQKDYPSAEIEFVWDRFERKGFSVANLPEAALRGLRRNPDVDHISADVWGSADKFDLRRRH